MSGYEPVLHALSVEPRVARPGDPVRLAFRIRNLGGLPSPAATVRFALPAGLAPLGAPAVAVEPVAPGADVVASLAARVEPGLDDRTELVVRAALELASGSFATNACSLVVRSRPLLDGPGSGVEVLALDGEIVRVRAALINEGDGPAHDLRVAVPVPAGCVALEGEGATRLALARLGVGETAALSYDARIVAPVDAVRAEGYAQAAGMRCALPSRRTVVPAPVLGPPRVALVPGRRRAELAIELRNDGWADAREVALRIGLPAPLRPLGGSLAVDGVPLAEDEPNGFARVVSGAAGLELVVARVPARGSVHVALGVRVPPAGALAPAEVLEVVLGEHAVSVPVAATPLRAVRLRVLRAPSTAEPGAQVELVAELANAGDLSETLILAAHGDDLTQAGPAAPITVAPGAVRAVPLIVRASNDIADGARLALTVSASDADGVLARTELTLTARDRPWLALSALPAREGERVAYALHNAGSTTARAVVARVGDEIHQLGAIAPGAPASFAVGERAARRGGRVSVNGRDELELPTLDERQPAEVRAALDAPPSAVAGAPFAVRLAVAAATAVDALAIRVPAVAGAHYVAGSTTLDGRALLDRGPGSPLAGDGLLLHGVPAATQVALAWSVLADSALCDASLEIGGELVADGDPSAIDAVRVAVRPREAFPARPAGLPYHVDACTLAPDGTLVPHASPTLHDVSTPDEELVLPAVVPATPPDDAQRESESQPAFTFALRLDGARVAEIASLLHGARGDGLAPHLLALRALFPERETSDDVLVADALRSAREALRDVFDRLFVKLRIPGFDVAAADFEDPALRRALVRLFERLLTAAPGDDGRNADAGRPAATASLACGRVREVLSSFADAPFGAPAMLRALAGLLPTHCAHEPRLANALASYARALDDALARCAVAPAAPFDDVLAHGEQPALDDARAALLAALRDRSAVAAP